MSNTRNICCYFYYIFIYLCMCVSVWATPCHGIPMEVREQLLGVNALLPPCESQRSNSCHQAWQQALLPAELPCQTRECTFWTKYVTSNQEQALNLYDRERSARNSPEPCTMMHRADCCKPEFSTLASGRFSCECPGKQSILFSVRRHHLYLGERKPLMDSKVPH